MQTAALFATAAEFEVAVAALLIVSETQGRPTTLRRGARGGGETRPETLAPQPYSHPQG